MKQNKHARSGSWPSPEGARLLYAGDTVNPMMCQPDGPQKNDKKGHTNTAKMRAKTTPKKHKQTATRWWLLVEFGFVCLVIRGDLVYVISQGYIAIYRDIMSRIVRYHKIR